HAVGATPEPVGAVIADEAVAEACRIDVLNIDERVDAEACILRADYAKVDMDRTDRAIREGCAIPAVASVQIVVADSAAQIVVAITSVDGVVTAARLQEIIAVAAVEDGGSRAYRDRVIVGGANDVLD